MNRDYHSRNAVSHILATISKGAARAHVVINQAGVRVHAAFNEAADHVVAVEAEDKPGGL